MIPTANAFGVIVIPEAVFSVFIAATWWWALRRRDAYVDWKRKAPFVGLALTTAALLIEFLLAAIVAPYGSLSGLDEAASLGGWSAVVVWITVGLQIASGLLPVAGLVLAIIGKGRPRVPTAIWSCVVFCTFVVNLFFAVNSFH